MHGIYQFKFHVCSIFVVLVLIVKKKEKRVFSFFDFRSSFSRFSDFIEASREKRGENCVNY